VADDARVPAQRGTRTTLGSSLYDRLAEAFAEELSTRLPRLLPAAARLRRNRTATSAATIKTIVSETHTLASSAVVLGAHDAARAARACEHRLLAYVDGSPLPAVVVEDALEHLDRMLSALSGWRAEVSAGAA
jgi:HPt (histidine-containing phosphotransfer) domain-containing protein